MKRVLILGGGFGGIATARRLKEKLDPKDEVILVDRRDHFMVGFRKTWALVGESTLEAGQRPLDSLTGLGIRVLHDPVTRIDPGRPHRDHGRSDHQRGRARRCARARSLQRRRSLAFNNMLTTCMTRRISRAPHRPCRNFREENW